MLDASFDKYKAVQLAKHGAVEPDINPDDEIGDDDDTYTSATYENEIHSLGKHRITQTH